MATTFLACSPAATQPASLSPQVPITPNVAFRGPHGPIGAEGPIVIKGVDPLGGWVVYCQARGDTDGDGKVAIGFGTHEAAFGDKLSLYLNLKTGEASKSVTTGRATRRARFW